MARDRSSIRRPLRPRRANVQAGFLVRVFILACVAVIGSLWALWRYYSHARPAMVVPVPAAPEWDAGAGLVPAPDIEVVPR